MNKKNFFILLNFYAVTIFPADTDGIRNFSMPPNALEQTIKGNETLKVREGKKFPSELRKLVLEAAPKIMKEYIECAKNPNCPDEMKAKRVLLHGSSGNGKTTLAQVFAQELGMQCIIVNAAILGNEYVNSVSENFAKQVLPFIKGPCVIVFDEMDSVLQTMGKNDPQQKVPQQIWQILDQLSDLPHVIVFGTSNTIKNMAEQIETRFADQVVEVPSTTSLPLRKKILQLYLKDSVCDCDEKFFLQLAEKTKDFSIREIEKLVKRAAAISFHRKSAPYLVSKCDFDEAFEELKKNKAAFKSEEPSVAMQNMQGGVWYGLGAAAVQLSVLAGCAVGKKYGIDCSFGGQQGPQAPPPGNPA